MSRKSWRVRRKQRVEFLEVHPEYWDLEKRAIVELMRQAGVVAPSTYWRDVGIEKMIQEIKGEKGHRNDND